MFALLRPHVGWHWAEQSKVRSGHTQKPTRADIGRSLPALKLLKPSGGDASTKLILLPDRRPERGEERRAVTKNSESPGFLLWLALQLMLAIRWRTMDEP